MWLECRFRYLLQFQTDRVGDHEVRRERHRDVKRQALLSLCGRPRDRAKVGGISTSGTARLAGPGDLVAARHLDCLVLTTIPGSAAAPAVGEIERDAVEKL